MSLGKRGTSAQVKFTSGLASIATGLKYVGNMGFHGVMINILDSQMCASSSVFFANWR